MSLITPILPFNCSACALPQANAAASAAKLRMFFIAVLLVLCAGAAPRREFSNPLILVQLFEVCVQFRIGEALDETAVFHEVIAVGHRRREAEILFNEQDGETLFLECADGAADLLDNHRRKPFGRLIKQQQARSGAQDAADCEHLLLAAGALGALAVQPL